MAPRIKCVTAVIGVFFLYFEVDDVEAVQSVFVERVLPNDMD